MLLRIARETASSSSGRADAKFLRLTRAGGQSDSSWSGGRMITGTCCRAASTRDRGLTSSYGASAPRLSRAPTFSRAFLLEFHLNFSSISLRYTVPPHSPALGGDIVHGRARKHYGNCRCVPNPKKAREKLMWKCGGSCCLPAMRVCANACTNSLPCLCSASALESVVLSRVCTPETLSVLPPVIVVSPHLPLHETDPSTLEAYSRRAAQMLRDKCGFTPVDV